MKLWKRMISFLISLLVVLSSTVFCVAKENNTLTVVDHVSTMLPIIMPEVHRSSEQVYIGTSIPAYFYDEPSRTFAKSEYEILPIIVNSEIVGTVEVIKVGDTVSQVSLGYGFAEELQNILQANPGDPFCILFSGENIYVRFFSGSTFAIREITGSALFTASNVKMEFTSFPETTVLVPQQKASRAIVQEYLDIENVENTSTACCSDGICWAACIAMMSNYFELTNYTALQIHDTYGCLPSTDYSQRQKSIILQLGMNVGTYDVIGDSGSFTYDNISYYIDNDRLLLLDLQTYGNGAHNVVLYGYAYNTTSSTKYFRYMDPNDEGDNGRLVSMPASAYTPTLAVTGGKVYTIHAYIPAW